MGMTENRLIDTLERLTEILKVDARRAGSRFGLQPVQMEVLRYLHLCNRFSDTPKSVTEYLGHTKGTVSQTLNVLEKKGLVVKSPDADDKRVQHLKLTDEGRKVIADGIPGELLRCTLDALSTDQEDQISTALHQFLETMLKANQLATFGVCASCRHHRRQDGKRFCELLQQPLTTADATRICREHRYH